LGHVPKILERIPDFNITLYSFVKIHENTRGFTNFETPCSFVSYKFCNAEEWMPKSHHAAQMDFAIWGILKRRLQKRKLYILAALKSIKG
jgi:hypothetical protein